MQHTKGVTHRDPVVWVDCLDVNFYLPKCMGGVDEGYSTVCFAQLDKFGKWKDDSR